MKQISQADEADREDIAEAGQAFARFLKSKGLGDAVSQIGRQNGEDALRMAIAAFAEARERRERNRNELEDEIPF